MVVQSDWLPMMMATDLFFAVVLMIKTLSEMERLSVSKVILPGTQYVPHDYAPAARTSQS